MLRTGHEPIVKTSRQVHDKSRFSVRIVTRETLRDHAHHLQRELRHHLDQALAN